MRSPRTRSTLVYSWALLLAGVFVVSWLGVPYIGGERAGLLEDDAYFYAQIAFNWQRYGFFTFDGLAPTSGFHPLWMALLSGLAKVLGLFTQDKAVHLAAYLTLWFAIVFTVATRVGRTSLERLTFLGVALLTTPLMETGLLSLLLLLAADRILRPEDEGAFDVPLCVATFLIPLTRIDAAPFLLLWLLPLRQQRSRLLAVAVGLIAGGAAHFATLEALFGNPYSVSSLLKATSATHGLPLLRAVGKSGIFVRVIVLVGLCAWAMLELRRTGSAQKRLAVILAPPVLFTAVHVLVSDVRGWYFLPAYAFAFWAGTSGGTSSHLSAEWNHSTHRKSRWQAHVWGAVVTATLILNAYKAYRFVPLNQVRVASWAFVENARRLLPAEARLYQIDGSGFTGYWLDRHLINGDGLVNTYDYARRLRNRKLKGYLEEQKVCYFITDAPLGPHPKTLVEQRGLTVQPSEAEELVRSEAYGWSPNRNAHFILWRLKAPRCAV